MKFYDCATAPSPRRVRIFLAEKGLTVPTVQVDLRNGEQFTPAFRALNPDCTVPVLSAPNLRAEIEKSWHRDARCLLHVARGSERASRGKRRGNGRSGQGGQDALHLAVRMLCRVAQAWQCRASARLASDGVFV